MTLATGTKLGPYEVVGLLGTGGMGEVYRARDDRLGREVAVKVLPPELSADPRRAQLFAQEARAAGALDHPNIVAVHDVGSEGGTVFIVTELLDGETLRERLRRGPLGPRQAAGVAAEVARGLAAAHRRGIVHRDLKPENLFLTREGRVKLLDFGIAKLLPAEDGERTDTTVAPDAPQTQPGALLGTVGYMSPEQARGEPADVRSDVFAVGAILYEMLSGRRAFAGGSKVETLHAILTEEPPPLAGLPPALERIVARCLEKDPERRFQSAPDLAFALETLSEVSWPGGVVPAAAGRRWRAWPWRWPAVAGALGLLAGLAATLWLTRPAPVPPLEIRPVSSARQDSRPAASPDGGTVAFVSERDGRPRIWLKQLAGGDEVALTAGPDGSPRFSPDGAAILFSRQEGARSALYRVSVLGGEPRKVVDDAIEGDLSPDGRRIAFVRTRSGPAGGWTALGVAAADGSSEREVARFAGRILVSPRWSPGGEWIAVVERLAHIANRALALILVDPASGARRSLAPALRGGVVSSLAWSGDGGALVYSEGGSVTGLTPASRVVAADVESGEARTLVWLPYVVRGIDLLGEGRLVFDAAAERETLREMPLAAGCGDGRWLTRGNSRDRQPVYVPGSDRVAFTSSRSGDLEIWAVATGSGAVARLTYDPAEDWDPAFTRDGRRLLWSTSRGGRFAIWIADADGRHARRLAAATGDAENPTATPGGRWVVYTLGRELWRSPLDGGRAVRLRRADVQHPEVSPDGRFVLYHTSRGAGWVELRALRTADGAPVPFRARIDATTVPISKLVSAPVSLGRARWLPDGRAIAFVGLDGQGRFAVFRQDFAPGRNTAATRRPLACALPDAVPESLAVSPDGSRLTVAYLEQDSSILLAEPVPGLRGPRRQDRP
jgi:Tol biopolymer transport system component